MAVNREGIIVAWAALDFELVECAAVRCGR
jgi:hypothetical protein